MRAFLILTIVLTVFTYACGGGGSGGGFAPTGKIVAVAQRASSNTIFVGGPKGAVTPGAAVSIVNLSSPTDEAVNTFAGSKGGFTGNFDASTADIFRVTIPEDEVDITIGVTLLEDAVSRNLATLGSVPSDIEILNGRAYVVNGFSDNVQVFDITQFPPVELGTIVLPLGQDPLNITFIDATRAVLPNNIGQSVAIVNIETFTCELIIASAPGDFTPCESSVVIPGAFEEPSGATVADGKLYVTNNNLNPDFSPNAAGFITVIDMDTLELVDIIDASAANTGNPTVINGELWALNSGNILFDFDTFLFTCDPAFEPSIDIIDISENKIVDSIFIPLDLMNNPNVCLPGTFSLTPDERFAYLGLGIVGAMMKVDIVNATLLRGADNPIPVTNLGTDNLISDIKFRDDGIGFMTLFNTDQIAVIDSATDQINPFPFVAPFPAGLRADDPDSVFFEGVQYLALPNDGAFPDLYFISAISSQLGTVDTSMVITP